MGRVISDSCGVMPATFFEALASCVMVDGNGDTFLNVMCFNEDCASFEPALHCGEQIDNPSAYVAAKAFAVDSCGYLALKLRVCVVADAELGEPQ
jgi:hypothetical protein